MMERLTGKRADGRWAIANNDNAPPFEQMKKIPKVIDRLAYYEDMEEQGRLVVLPAVAERDRQAFVDGLHDYFKEAAFEDRSVGIFGMTEGEKTLSDALMGALCGGNDNG